MLKFYRIDTKYLNREIDIGSTYVKLVNLQEYQDLHKKYGELYKENTKLKLCKDNFSTKIKKYLGIKR